jgi:hypothetical protein
LLEDDPSALKLNVDVNMTEVVEKDEKGRGRDIF